MSLHPELIGEVPAETARVARAAFPKGTVATRLRDEFSALFEDEDFRTLYPAQGQPGFPPWRLALVTVFQLLEHPSDRQAADAVRARIDWNSALGLELTDPGFHFSVLAEFRARLVAKGAEHLLLDRMLERFKERGLVKARGKQRTDSTHVLAAVHDLHLLELVAETLRAALDDMAAAAPDWLHGVVQPACERYGRRIEEHRLPKGQDKRQALALEIGADGFVLLDALHGPTAPAAARELPMLQTLRDVWLPAEDFVDSGYVDAELPASNQRDFGLSLEGPVRGVSSRVGHGYGLRHFAIDWGDEQVTCPQGKTSVSWRTIRVADGSPRLQALFSRGDCRACSARAMCTLASSGCRTVHVHLREAYEALNAARARMTDPAWVERHHRRAGVEGTLSQGVRAFGMRRM